MDAGFPERGQDLPLQALVRALQQSGDLLAYALELSCREHSIRTTIENTFRDLALETGDSHHEELVKVGAHDGQELDSFQQRDGLVLSLFKHSSLKIQETEFAIHVELRIIERGSVGRGRARGAASAIARIVVAPVVIAPSSIAPSSRFPSTPGSGHSSVVHGNFFDLGVTEQK
jgi:hypothetical protein